MLTGEVIYHGLGFLIISNQGIGYKVILPEDAAHGLRGMVTLYTHEVIRDSERELFGFRDVVSLELFWKLISISGVGPRIAQKIVFSGVVEKVKERIMAGDLAFLTTIPGVGKKTAQKIILELKGALAQEPDASVFDQDAIGALMGLGYSNRDAEQILSQVQADTTEERIRLALKFLGR